MKVLVRGGGDLASGTAIRLFRAGFRVLITEVHQPLAVRRLVAFSEAVYQGRTEVEGVTAVRVSGPAEIDQAFIKNMMPVIIDPEAQIRHMFLPAVLVDARMTKKSPDLGIDAAPLVIGLGPGFIAGEDCHAVIETKRGHTLGRVFWQGATLSDTGIPEMVGAAGKERVLRAPASGVMHARTAIGAMIETDQLIADVEGHKVTAPFAGVLRGLLPDGFAVTRGMKIGDIDPRADPISCRLVSDKALAIGGGVLEAVLATTKLWPNLVDE